ncbi:MAG: hypothetical protein KatS3mg036_0486 [Ignavibacterium sp.]|uniref:helix-turn-helix transcriptional regulator n=1 Tax=Ignavibacterium sp. TaxID=2651167 RepID=UPI0021DF2CE4|nr:sigma factor-like helix-turn-helix DNA-binding protein [Ignavibacterium sp.]BDQ01932.1 MAG: hypothetical protein KatS3mg037_0507 [Ignavibacterium sp.]GIV45668.1 MAG: hypothetical protein KatS3mg036_0486 [Ignavibacterium sp.]
MKNTYYLDDFQYDSIWLLERQQELETRAYESKRAQFRLEIIIAAIKDFTTHKTTNLEITINNYLDEEDRAEINYLYKRTNQLLEKLTEKQINILFFYLVERMRISEIAEAIGITKQTVFKQIKSIRKKGSKILDNKIFQGGESYEI